MTLDALPAVRGVPSVTAEQMAEIDRITTLDFQIPVDVLMENASRQIAAAARALLGGSLAGKRVIALVGSGNNGGDAAGALRHLLNWGARVSAEVTGPQDRMRDTARRQLMRILLATTADIAIVHDASQNGPRDLGADLLIDGLLGYSAHGAPREPVAALIDAANASYVPILAVDLPSGIDPDSGAVPGTAIRAAATVTLALPKPGLLAPEAHAYVGDLLLADIAVPHAAFWRIGLDTGSLFVDGDLVRILR
ncbi:MAG: NAD(P)H-hydrate epimerase [Chloroflexi bacterium]|nr:MAG: NAD(P)H-hydrate epimerase [Chloroflexota bacterium]